MKKLFFLPVFFLLCATAQGQKIEKKDIIGKWNVVYVKIRGDIFNVKEGTAVPSDTSVKAIGKSHDEVTSLMITMMNKDLKGSYFLFDINNRVENKILGKTQYDDYSLKEKNGNYLLKIGPNEYMVSLSANRMRIIEEGKDDEMIFEKE